MRLLDLPVDVGGEVAHARDEDRRHDPQLAVAAAAQAGRAAPRPAACGWRRRARGSPTATPRDAPRRPPRAAAGDDPGPGWRLPDERAGQRPEEQRAAGDRVDERADGDRRRRQPGAAHRQVERIGLVADGVAHGPGQPGTRVCRRVRSSRTAAARAASSNRRRTAARAGWRTRALRPRPGPARGRHVAERASDDDGCASSAIVCSFPPPVPCQRQSWPAARRTRSGRRGPAGLSCNNRYIDGGSRQPVCANSDQTAPNGRLRSI